jgi:hypothetical protein
MQYKVNLVIKLFPFVLAPILKQRLWQVKSERVILIPNQQIFALTPCSYFIWPRCGVLLRFTDYDWPLVSSNPYWTMKAGQLIWRRCNLHHRYKLRTNYYFLMHSANHICGVKVSVLASSSNSGRVNSNTIKLVFVASPLSKDASNTTDMVRRVHKKVIVCS